MGRAFLLVALACCAAVGSRPVAAQAPAARVQGRVAVYTDDDRTTVWRPRVSGAAPMGRWSAGASWTADVVSSASIDVVTIASRPVEDTRHELGASVGYYGDDALELTAGYVFGTEVDHQSHALSLGVARDLGELRLWNAGALLGLSRSTVGAVVDDRFEERAWTTQLALSLSRIVDRRTVMRAALEGSWTEGFQASPYRVVRLGDWTAAPYEGDDPDAPAWVFSGVTGAAREHHPDRRLRARLALDAVRDLGAGVAAFGQLSGYADSWGIEAAEAALEARWEPVPDLLLRAGARGYFQASAWFWRRRYHDPEQTDGFLTADRELGPMRTLSTHLAAGGWIGAVRLDGRVELTRYDHPDFDLRPSLHAIAAQLGLTWEPSR